MKKEEVLTIMIKISEHIQELNISSDLYDLYMSSHCARMIQMYTSLIEPCTKGSEYYGYLWGYGIKIAWFSVPEFQKKLMNISIDM